MASAFEVDPDLESGFQTDEYDSEYDETFEEEDFLALGIDPQAPTDAKPGSTDKVLMLAARYAAGLPLWHEEDCYDHGPDSVLMDELNEESELDDEDE